MPQSSLSETARERELFRYFQPDVDTLSHLSREARRNRKVSSNDVSLTAFAQLGAFRLNGSRGIISLSSRDKDYVLAESGKSMSLQDDNNHEEGDEMVVGSGEKNSGELSLIPVAMDRLRRPSTDPLSLPHFFVGDMTKDDRFKNKPLVTGYPFARSFMSYPIRTPAGYVIGMYSVFNTYTRGDLNEIELQFLKDMATTVMDHVKSMGLKRKSIRGERMVKALGLFIEGKSSLRDWWISQQGQSIKLRKSNDQTPEFLNMDHAADIEFGIQNPPDRWVQGLENTHVRDHLSESQLSPNAVLKNYEFGRPPMMRLSTTSSGTTVDQSITSMDSSNIDPVFERRWATASQSTADTPVDSGSSTPHIIMDTSQGRGSFDATSGRKLQEALVSTDMRSAFSRAANLIREAIGIDGAIFYETNLGSVNGSARKASSIPLEAPMNGISETTSSSEEDLQRKGSMALSPLSSKPSIHSSQDKTCTVLGYSTRARSSLNGHVPSDNLNSLPEVILRRLLKKYPTGKVFNFDEDGSISASESDGYSSTDPSACSAAALNIQSTKSHVQNHSKNKRISHRQEAEAIAKALPKVRSAVFFPLWDASKERWTAGSFIWSSSPMRVLCPLEDISYIAAFGNSIVAELSRISALLSGQMKVDFTSSISHELRSPLHGVLASVEFLQDTPMTEMQADMVNTIHSCGNTLLDTINHVLDFSKVNSKFKDSTKLRKKTGSRKRDFSRSRRMSKAQINLEETENISVLAEEVIDSVYAGYRVGKRLSNPSIPHRLSSSSEIVTPPVTVIVDIAWRQDWNFVIDAGAWRRILMNIFGNSMKYTTRGLVHVSIDVDESLKSRDGSVEPRLSLTVRDSGKGISEDFLKNELYKPFSQEDGLAPGTGLGLSIVRQIIRDSGGSIHYTSEKGTGTEARVSLPLNQSTVAPSAEDNDSGSIIKARQVTKGLQACLVAFNILPSISEEPTGILSPEAEAIMCLKSSISTICTDWLGMDIIPNPVDSSKVDVVVVLESGIGSDRNLESVVRNITDSSLNPVTVLVLCTSYDTDAHTLCNLNRARVFYISQPYGPIKLTHALHNALVQTSDIHQPLQPTSTKIGTQKILKVNKNVTIRAPPIKPNSILQFGDSPGNIGLNGAELKVLLVEDNEINLKLLVAYMEKLKLPHTTAVNGLEALHTYQAARGGFNLIFMDISMPIMDGLQASREIRDFEKQENIPATIIIALTGAASMKSRQEAFRSGVDLFLTKPVPMKKLKGILQDLGNPEVH